MSASWPERDANTIWHPFTQLNNSKENIAILKSEGSAYFDEEGNRIIDAISSWWVNLHGHCNPYISKRVSAQLFSNEHSIFSGFTHPNAILLAEKLLHHLPSNQSKIFYSDNGSTAVEVALKMAFQFFYNQNIERNEVIYLQGAYHGDTFGGMSVAERNAFNSPFKKLLFNAHSIDLPIEGSTAVEQISSIIKGNKKIAAFIFEPLLQGAGGMCTYSSELLDECINLCKTEGIICIADEVMTGFYRTGKFFASEYLKNQPDIMCLSKGLTGGYLPLGVTSCTQKIQDAFKSSDALKTFYHGHSYTANPTACAAGIASIELLEKLETKNRIKEIVQLQNSFAEKLKSRKGIIVRQLGTVLAIEKITRDKTNYLNTLSEKIYSFFIKKGILMRPLGNVFYVLPPYCISNEDLNYIYSSIEEFLNESE